MLIKAKEMTMLPKGTVLVLKKDDNLLTSPAINQNLVGDTFPLEAELRFNVSLKPGTIVEVKKGLQLISKTYEIVQVKKKLIKGSK